MTGKILAVNPKLTPEAVIDIMIKTSTKSKEEKNVLLIHLKNAIELALKNNFPAAYRLNVLIIGLI